MQVYAKLCRMSLLGDYRVERSASSFLSAAELMEREGMMLQKSMNFRTGERLSVFLVLPRGKGEYGDGWDAQLQEYSFLGHDSTTAETKVSNDQLLTYGSGTLTDNGKFYKAAKEFRDGVRAEPLQVQVYEKIDAGTWFDKGIFNLIDAREIAEDGRRAYVFLMRPSDMERHDRDDTYRDERFLTAGSKRRMWVRDMGRCVECDAQLGLRFAREGSAKELQLLCPKHRGKTAHRGLLG